MLVNYVNILTHLVVIVLNEHMNHDYINAVCMHIFMVANSIMDTIDVKCNETIRKNLHGDNLLMYTKGYDLLRTITDSYDKDKIWSTLGELNPPH